MHNLNLTLQLIEVVLCDKCVVQMLVHVYIVDQIQIDTVTDASLKPLYCGR
jgi:hypothetical protein